jgi:methylglutaconyl-CoA hydratase
MPDHPVLWSLDARGAARITLNRPELNNAYDLELVEGLHDAMDALRGRPDLRVVVIAGNGKHFQTGADLEWMSELRMASVQENELASRETAAAIDRLNRLPVPTIALVHGYCVGGGTGLIAACDIVIAADDAKFAIPEVRWGLTAAIIIPQLNDAIGVRQVRRYALTGERIDAPEARRIGLVHEVVPAAELEATGELMVTALLANGPQAMAESKAIALEHAFGTIGGAMARLIESHAAKRRSEEAAEGLASYAEKRPARWR